jgi:hypothetical protein
VGYHHNPIEPDDIRFGPADEPEMIALCPKCNHTADELEDGFYECTSCDWYGADVKFEAPSDSEPDYGDFV